MKKAVSMPCTQAQFETIKDDLIKGGCKIDDIRSWDVYTFLTNNFDNKPNVVSNIYESDCLNRNRELIPEFDKSKFLDACGIETETVFLGTDFQFNTGDGMWVDCPLENYTFRLKPKPDFSKEIEALQEKAKQSGFSVTVNFEKL